MKIGICNEMFEKRDIEKIFPFVGEIGYNGVEIAPFTIAETINSVSEEKRKQIKASAQKNGIEIIGTHWLLASPQGLSVSSENAETRKITSEYLKNLVIFTEQIGGNIMVFGSPKQRNVQENQSYGQAKDYFKEAIMPALEEAKARSVTICLEPLGRKETNFVNTAGQAIEIIREVNHPNFRLHLDVKAMSDEQKPIPEIIKEGIEYLAHFHANDENCLGPGFGNTDFKPIINTLKEVGYNGYLCVEVFDFSPGADNIAKKSIEYLKQLL